MKKREKTLRFLDRFKGDDWRRALILAEILSPPVARRATPRRKILGQNILSDEELRHRPL